MRHRLLGAVAAGATLVAANVAASAAHAQDSKPAASEAPQAWTGPFGGTISATFAFTSDYSYRGISQTQRQIAFQADWQIGVTATVYGVTLAYTDTNIDIAGCLNTLSCEARAIFMISKTF